MKFLYDLKNQTLKELKENGKVYKLTRIESKMLFYLANNKYISPVELLEKTECESFERLHFNMRKLGKKVTITRTHYVGSKIEDTIWII